MPLSLDQMSKSMYSRFSSSLVKTNPSKYAFLSWSSSHSVSEIAKNVNEETAVDADNASGALSGIYSYDWQLSDDGGANWTTVATDADYTIRSADVDKKLRTLVSYTDEGGFTHTDVASSNSLDTVSLAAIAVDTNQSLIGYQYRLQKSEK